TEITSTVYYRLLQRYSPIPALASMCALILRDEAGHIAFHRDRLAAERCSGKGFRGRLWAAQFGLCGYAAATMLWINHRNCLISLNASAAEFYGEVRIELRRFLRTLGAKENVPLRPQLSEKTAQTIPFATMSEIAQK